ncbi:hypothetical protein AYO40_02045 [Planctomycetaceae bacterium SCGC AG-212-D15]|nr:hypothetical protein AYO40_02045 [Planctomycetaceae bacterium SCGC AG-212-D15]
MWTGVSNYISCASRLVTKGQRKPDRGATLNPFKLRLIDFACRRQSLHTLADLGAVWNVDGGYTFYALEKHNLREAWLVDFNARKEEVVRRAKQYPQLHLIQGNFADLEVVRQIGEVDAVLLFDVLLHQVAPNWKEVLDRYSPKTRCFLIYNQQFVDFPRTTRLIDLGRERYFRCVPHQPDDGEYRGLFDKLEQVHPTHRCKHRNSTAIWQWGIVNHDLSETMAQLGFELVYFEKCHQWPNIEERVEDHAFVFCRR